MLVKQLKRSEVVLFEWLNGFQKLEQKIYYLDWELETYKNELKRWCDPDDLGRYSLTKDSKSSKLENIIENHELRLAYFMDDMFNLRKIIYGFEGLDQHIMRMKYVEGLTLKEIAKELNHGYTYMKKRHARLLKDLESERGYQEDTNSIAKS